MAQTPKPGRKRRGFRQTGACIAADVRRVSEKRGFAETRLLTDWEEICGKDIAAVATPLRVSYGREGLGATLTIACQSARAPEVSMQAETIRTRVNACYGYNAIARIRVTQTGSADIPAGFAEGQAQFTPKAPPPLKPAVSAALEPIGDEGLRAALARLGQNVQTRTHQKD
ncbi:DUF721 domain-containing protein [Algicella marina]|uniref:DUF721 domain-containing protein n=1 Tax=Algicella marina TaxID=2683284 RepID=A0A6P1T1H6_9RHOB|nr:DciA family protein [Algicella marina]QHQ36764.1 DUF721 domain-containing protein [Algicella marina]